MSRAPDRPDEIALDYIYGMALHEDEYRLDRLQNVSSQESILQAVMLTLNDLLHIARNVRRHVLHDIDADQISIELTQC